MSLRDNAVYIIDIEDLDSTFIKASVPITSGRYLVPMPASIESVKSEKYAFTESSYIKKF